MPQQPTQPQEAQTRMLQAMLQRARGIGPSPDDATVQKNLKLGQMPFPEAPKGLWEAVESGIVPKLPPLPDSLVSLGHIINKFGPDWPSVIAKLMQTAPKP